MDELAELMLERVVIHGLNKRPASLIVGGDSKISVGSGNHGKIQTLAHGLQVKATYDKHYNILEVSSLDVRVANAVLYSSGTQQQAIFQLNFEEI